jgi:hypothetical protein
VCVETTHKRHSVTAKLAFACLQYPMFFLSEATSQLLVMYQGAPLCGWFLSVISDADCPYVLYAYRTTSKIWIRTESIGMRARMKNKTGLTSIMNIESTEITTL